MFLDIHTHSPAPRQHIVAVQSYDVNDVDIRIPDAAPPNTLFSAGMHPLTLDPAHSDAMLNAMEQTIKRNSVIAIGEIGFDTRAAASLPMQQSMFAAQVRMAESQQKPVVIHCVHAYNELLAAHTSLQPRTAWIVHGFAKHPHLAGALAERGMILSFGHKLLDVRSHAAASLKLVQQRGFFLETDMSDTHIEDIYARAAAILSLSVDEVAQLVQHTYEQHCA